MRATNGHAASTPLGSPQAQDAFKKQSCPRGGNRGTSLSHLQRSQSQVCDKAGPAARADTSGIPLQPAQPSVTSFPSVQLQTVVFPPFLPRWRLSLCPEGVLLFALLSLAFFLSFFLSPSRNCKDRGAIPWMAGANKRGGCQLVPGPCHPELGIWK